MPSLTDTTPPQTLPTISSTEFKVWAVDPAHPVLPLTQVQPNGPMQALTSMIPERTDYNGWTNYETWNVALWLENNESMYRIARIYGHSGYDHLIPTLEVNFGQMTPDGVRWMDGRIDTEELDEMLEDL